MVDVIVCEEPVNVLIRAWDVSAGGVGGVEDGRAEAEDDPEKNFREDDDDDEGDGQATKPAAPARDGGGLRSGRNIGGIGGGHGDILGVFGFHCNAGRGWNRAVVRRWVKAVGERMF